ncbi:MAG: GTP-binding protein, partial [Pirellulaceae bacterium]|nr:GTP-binding protein [Pirellulaceae bacterium]
MKTTPKGLRLQIGIFGRRNAGKSSLLNALTRQQTSIVSPVPGTTTDPVEKPMEMLPLGPVLWIDTAGLEDSGALGRQRIEKSRRILDRADAAVLVVDADLWGDFEEGLLQELRGRKVPVVVAFNKSDVTPPQATVREKLSSQKIPCVDTVASTGQGVPELREALIGVVPDDFLRPPPLLADLVTPGELAVLVTPIDLEAPKGRLILPQVQAIRDLLDGDAICLVVKEHGLRAALERLTHPPA